MTTRSSKPVSQWTRELRKAGALTWVPLSLSVAIAIAAWLVDWPALIQPSGVSGVLRALGILTGAAGTALWVACLVLMLRFPALDRCFDGLDRQYFAHHIAGTLAYLLLLAHPVLLVAAARVVSPPAATALALPWGQGPAVIVGWLALVGLMVMMFATFFARFGYARWKQVHAASALAYVFALAHVAELLPAWGEGRLGAVVLVVAMVGGLFAIALRRQLDRTALAARSFVVERVTRVSPTAVEVVLVPLTGREPFAFVAGQFVFVAFDAGPGYVGCHEYHPFTIASAPSTARITLLIRAFGRCTMRMQGLAPGTPARVQGPYGGIFRNVDPTRPQVWIAGGIGITPFMAMAEALPESMIASVDLYFLARDSHDAPGLATLRATVARRPRLRLFELIANEGTGVVRAAVMKSSAPLVGRDIYLCGPSGMIEATLAWLADEGVPEARIHAERFDFR